MQEELQTQDDPAVDALEEALAATDHTEARFHIRHALQYLIAEAE